MNKDKFIDIITDSVKGYGMNGNEFVNIMGHLLSQQKDFYQTAQVPERNLKLFNKMLLNGDVPQLESEDLKPMVKSSYWNRSDPEFIYTVRILPNARKKIRRDSYKKIFNGENILKAGIDDASKKNTDLPTIWNIIEKEDVAEASGKTAGVSSFKNLSKEGQRNVVDKIITNLSQSGEISNGVANSISQNNNIKDAMAKVILKFQR